MAARAQALGYMRVLSVGTVHRIVKQTLDCHFLKFSSTLSPGSSQNNHATQSTAAPDAHIWNRNKGDEEYRLYVRDRTINPEEMKGFKIENRYKYWNRNKGDEGYRLYVRDRTINPEKMEGFKIVQW
ncbi:hypothetical protein RSAG8_13776, partial [Rhizoctonia solani AG-8 WAC10335]